MAISWFTFITLAASVFIVSTVDQPECGENEYLDECPADSPADFCPNCERQNKRCLRPDPCPSPRCKCTFNHRRAKNGTCILTRNCPPFDCPRPNEQYIPCAPFCPSDACGPSRITGLCTLTQRLIKSFGLNSRECNPKCQCQDGYGRLYGICVPLEECPDLCPENEEYNSCVQRVCRPQFCSNIRTTLVPKLDYDVCKKGCICKENYYRDEKGTCVTEDECNVLRCPNPNEEFTISRIPNCPALDTCISILADIICDEPEVPGCTCKTGYLRLNVTTPCISICDCPENEGFECEIELEK